MVQKSSHRMRDRRGRPARADERPDRLGRFLALVLRHKPESIGVALDESGFVEIDLLAHAIAAQPGWSSVTEEAIRAVAHQDVRRYEIDGTRIRARYGHSVPIEKPGTAILPPEWLYHGTAPEALEGMSREGLTPQGRQYVHLSVTRQDALAVGQRHSAHAVVVTVLARQAHAGGVHFYQASPTIFLARDIPSQYLVFPTESAKTPPTAQE